MIEQNKSKTIMKTLIGFFVHRTVPQLSQIRFWVLLCELRELQKHLFRGNRVVRSVKRYIRVKVVKDLSWTDRNYIFNLFDRDSNLDIIAWQLGLLTIRLPFTFVIEGKPDIKRHWPLIVFIKSLFTGIYYLTLSEFRTSVFWHNSPCLWPLDHRYNVSRGRKISH